MNNGLADMFFGGVEYKKGPGIWNEKNANLNNKIETESQVTEKVNKSFSKFSNLVLGNNVDDIKKVPLENKRLVFFAVMGEMEKGVIDKNTHYRKCLSDLGRNFDARFLVNKTKNTVSNIISKTKQELRTERMYLAEMMKKGMDLMNRLKNSNKKEELSYVVDAM